MKILVTGGAGFIGSNFVHYLCEKYPDYQVVVLDKLTYAGHKINLSGLNIEFIVGDICDPETVNRAMNGVDIVVHFAAESHVDRSITGPEAFIQTNVIGTHVLLQHALKHQVKLFHHVSTDEVFGSLDRRSKHKFNEETTVYNPRSPYSASKAASDHLVKAYFYTYGLPVTISNCSNNYGPYQHPEKLIPLTITNLMAGKKIPVYDDGGQMRDWLHVEDHCKAIDLIIKGGRVGETYLVGGLTEDVTNLEIIKMLLKILGKGNDSIEFVKDRAGHDQKYAVDWNKIKTELGWQPSVNLSEGLEKTVKWYQENEWWWKPLKENK
jgi:dTDP-glucose 4,6-dehydratase